MLKACLNGVRRPGEHPALPVTPAELGAEAARAVAAGAEALHVHPKDAAGADCLEPDVVAGAVRAVRAAVPGVPVGVTTGAWALPDAGARQRTVGRWVEQPDFASVNWHEEGAPELAELLLARGVGVEAGLWTLGDVAAWRGWAGRERGLRVLVEVSDRRPPDEVLTLVAALLDAVAGTGTAVPVLLHGAGGSCWPVLAEAVRRGLDTRIGLEDVLVLPDGRPAAGNADLVAAARALIDA